MGNYNAFRKVQKRTFKHGVFATIAAPNTPTGAGVFADRCNPSDGPPASYELLSSRLLRPTPGWSESGLTCERSGLKRKKAPFSDAGGSRSVSCDLLLLLCSNVPGQPALVSIPSPVSAPSAHAGYWPASTMPFVPPVTCATGVSCSMPNQS